jgi:hypothetical protein
MLLPEGDQSRLAWRQAFQTQGMGLVLDIRDKQLDKDRVQTSGAHEAQYDHRCTWDCDVDASGIMDEALLWRCVSISGEHGRQCGAWFLRRRLGVEAYPRHDRTPQGFRYAISSRCCLVPMRRGVSLRFQVLQNRNYYDYLGSNARLIEITELAQYTDKPYV